MGKKTFKETSKHVITDINNGNRAGAIETISKMLEVNAETATTVCRISDPSMSDNIDRCATLLTLVNDLVGRATEASNEAAHFKHSYECLHNTWQRAEDVLTDVVKERDKLIEDLKDSNAGLARWKELCDRADASFRYVERQRKRYEELFKEAEARIAQLERERIG